MVVYLINITQFKWSVWIERILLLESEEFHSIATISSL